MFKSFDRWSVETYDELMGWLQRRGTKLPDLHILHGDVYVTIAVCSMLALSFKIPSPPVIGLCGVLGVLVILVNNKRRKNRQRISDGWHLPSVRMAALLTAYAMREKMTSRMFDVAILLFIAVNVVLGGMDFVDALLVLGVVSGYLRELADCALPQDPQETVEDPGFVPQGA